MEASEKQREGSAMDQAGGTESGTIDSVLAHNRAFVAGGEFARYATDKYPDKKLAVVSCMDTVSYTHLDVYKRQSHGRGAHANDPREYGEKHAQRRKSPRMPRSARPSYPIPSHTCTMGT